MSLTDEVAKIALGAAHAPDHLPSSRFLRRELSQRLRTEPGSVDVEPLLHAIDRMDPIGWTWYANRTGLKIATYAHAVVLLDLLDLEPVGPHTYEEISPNLIANIKDQGVIAANAAEVFARNPEDKTARIHAFVSVRELAAFELFVATVRAAEDPRNARHNDVLSSLVTHLKRKEIASIQSNFPDISKAAAFTGLGSKTAMMWMFGLEASMAVHGRPVSFLPFLHPLANLNLVQHGVARWIAFRDQDFSEIDPGLFVPDGSRFHTMPLAWDASGVVLPEGLFWIKGQSNNKQVRSVDINADTLGCPALDGAMRKVGEFAFKRSNAYRLGHVAGLEHGFELEKVGLGK